MAKNVDTPKWHNLGVAEVISSLGSSDKGLSDKEVQRRLAEFGPNELKKEERISPFALFIGQFKNILIMILLIAIVLSAVIGELIDAGIIAAIVIFCAVLGFTQEYRAERALEALKKMLSPTITVLREGKEEEVPSKELVPGDMLILEAGDKIPADARLVESHSLMCEEAPLEKRTGEIGKWIGIIALSIFGLILVFSVVRQVFGGGKIDLPFIVTMGMFA